MVSLPRPPKTVPRVCALPVITTGAEAAVDGRRHEAEHAASEDGNPAPSPPRTEPPTKLPAVEMVSLPSPPLMSIGSPLVLIRSMVSSPRAAVDRVGAVAGTVRAAREHIVTPAAVDLDPGGEVRREDVGRVVPVAEIERRSRRRSGRLRQRRRHTRPGWATAGAPEPAVRPAVSRDHVAKEPRGAASRTVTWFTSPCRATRRSTPASSTASVEAPRCSRRQATRCAARRQRRSTAGCGARSAPGRPRSPACSGLADREVQACDGSEQPWRPSFGFRSPAAEARRSKQYRDRERGHAHP